MHNTHFLKTIANILASCTVLIIITSSLGLQEQQFFISNSTNNSVNSGNSNGINNTQAISLEVFDLTVVLAVTHDMPAYIAGFDNSNKPIWIYEVGHYNLRKYFGSGQAELVFKYIRYTSYESVKSHALKSTPEKPVHQHITVLDFEGLKLDTIMDRQVIDGLLHVTRKHRRFQELYISKQIFLNVNAIGEVVLNVIRPYLGRYFNRIEVYGTNKYEYVPKLLKIFGSADILPGWYGGNKNFKPVYVLG